VSSVYTSLGHYVNVTGIAECITERLAETTAGVPRRVCIYPGEVAWDACECGMLALTTSRIFPSSSFPTLGGETISDCGMPYMVATLEITMLRCIPSIQEGKSPPTCTQLGNAARIQYEDAFAVWQGTLCCLRLLQDNDFIQEFAMGTQVFIGPQGLCGGSTLTVDLGYVGPCC
jgi:hypothetical protein